MKNLSILLMALFCICVAEAQNVGIGTNDPKAKLDINGSLALREGPAISLVNGGASGGANDNIVLPDITTGVKAGFYRITGPTAAFSVFGIVPATGADGQLVTLVNTTNNVMTIKNNASSTAANGFKTLTGSDMVSVAGNSSITIQYNKTESRWYVTGSQNYLVTTGSIATGDITTSNNAVTLTNNTGRLVGNSTLTIDVKNNDLNQKGLVPGPTGGNGNQVWGTDAAGYPAWQKVNNNMLNSSSITVNNGTGVSVSGSPVSLGGSITITNTAPDQTVVLNNGTGIAATGTYPNFTITNTAPDQTVAITSGAGISATGTYPNFTIANTGDLSNTNEAQTLAGSGTNDINLSQAGGAGGGTITLQGSGATSVSRSGNTFTISSTSSGGTVTGTGTPTQVTFWNTTTGITSDANFYWDNTNKRLGIGSTTGDAQTVSIRGYSNSPTNWKGSGAFGFTSAAVIMGELNGVAQIGGHSGTLNAWATLALNSGGGNVGVGTVSPAYKFDVTGDARATGNVLAGTHMVIQYSDPYLRTDADNKHMVLSGGSGWTTTGATMVLRGASAGYNPHGLEWYTGNAERARILSNGNMGIGTASPAYLLDVNGITGVNYLTAKPQDGTNEGGEIQLQGAGSNTTLQIDNYAGNIRIHTLASGKYFDVLGGSGIRGTGAQLTGLGGGGTRMVTTDNNGTLGTQTLPGGVLPAGSASNTLYHNGTSWVAGSNLANDGSTITLGNFSNSNTDEWPKVQWLRAGNYDEGLIKGSTARGAWGREGFGIHMHSTKHFAFYSTGWDPLFDVEGGTGRTYIKGNTGISTTTPASLLHVMGKINLHQSGTSGGQNRFEGLEAATSANGRAQFVLSSSYSDLVIASSQANDNHGSTLTFATYNPSDANDYRKFVINQGNWGARRGFLDFGFSDAGGRTNPHSNINGTDNVMTLDGFNKRVGIGYMSPATRLEVGAPSGNVSSAILHSSGGQAWGNVLTVATDGAGDNPRINFSYRNKAKHWQIGGYNADTRFSIWEDGGDGVYGSGWGSERLTILAGGNVGVGTSSPLGKFHVAGNHANGVMVDGNDRPSMAATGIYPQMVLMSGNSGNGNHGATIMLGGYDAGAAGNHKHWSIGTSGANSTFLDIGYHNGTDLNPHAGIRNYNGSTFMTILNSGNVGVGITTPNAKLDVSTGSDGIAMGQIHGDNTNTIQSYIDGQWANRASYAGGCCNALLIQPDVGTVGIGTTGPGAKLHVVGNAVTGTIIAAAGNSYQTDWPGGWGGGMAGWDLCIASMRYSGLSQRSDMRLKKDIKELPATMSALDIVDRLRPVSYGYIDKRIARKVHFGFIAQEVQQILPEIVEVGTDSMQTLGMSYIDLIPILTQAVKDQQKQINELKQSAANNTPAESPKMAELQEQNRILLEKLTVLTKRLEELEKNQ